MAWHDFYGKKILGTVPVEDDGSAYFEVPSEKFVYFQLLDEEGKMIQSMRSGTYVQPGELARVYRLSRVADRRLSDGKSIRVSAKRDPARSGSDERLVRCDEGLQFP